MTKQPMMKRWFVILGLSLLLSGVSDHCLAQPIWQPLQPMPLARQEVGVGAIDGLVYVVGGFDPMIDTVNTVEFYDLKQDRWFPAASLPIGVHHPAAAVVDGSLYIIGGLSGFSFTAVDRVYAYDPKVNRWSPRASLPRPRGAGAAATLDGKIYFVGGFRSQPVGDFTVYDPELDEWQELEPLPTARDHLAAGFFGGRFYAVGGRVGNQLFPDFDSYDPVTEKWTSPLPPLPTARAGLAAVPAGQYLFVIGGEGNVENALGIFPQVEAYDFRQRQWQTMPDMTSPRHGIGAAVVASKIVIPGGSLRAGFPPTEINEALTFPDAEECVGDCNLNLQVSADEIDRAIQSLFSVDSHATCLTEPAVRAADLLLALRAAAQGCQLGL